MWVYAVSTVTLLLSPVNTHVTLPEGGVGEVRHGQPDGDQPAGANITHVGRLLSGGLEARDGLTDCRPPVCRCLASLLSLQQPPAPSGRV